MIFLGLDLNCAISICDPAKNSLAGGIDELGQTGVRASHAAFAADHVSPLRRALWRSAQGQELFLSRPIPLHGVRSTDLSRQFARHRSVPARTSGQAVAGFRAALWPMPTRIATGSSTPTLPSRSLPSPVVFMPQSPLASTSKIRSMLWMPAPSTCACRYFLGLRFARPRRPSSCTRFWTCAATSLRFSTSAMANCTTSTFWICCCPSPALSTSWTEDTSTLNGFISCTRRKLLCHPRQIQPQSPASLFASGRSKHGLDLRSDHRAHQLLLSSRLRHAAASRPIQRPHNRQAVGVPYQQFHLASIHHHRALSLPVAGRVVFQMDQAASSYQSLLRYLRERRQNPNLDCGLGLCARRHRQKATQPLGELV